MEGVKSRTGNQSRLVSDPNVLHSLKGIGKDNPLTFVSHSKGGPIC